MVEEQQLLPWSEHGDVEWNFISRADNDSLGAEYGLSSPYISLTRGLPYPYEVSFYVS